MENILLIEGLESIQKNSDACVAPEFFFIGTLDVCERLHATRDSYRSRDRRQNRDDDLENVLDGFFFHGG